MITPVEYKNSKIPIIKTNTNVKEAIEIAKKHKIYHLLVINDNNKFLGLIPIKSIDEKYYNKQVKDLPEELLKPLSVLSDQHIYEALSLMYNYSLEFIPVVDKEYKLLGILDKTKMFGILINLTKAHVPGSTIMIRIPKNHYSLTHIASIIESENAKIISVFSQYNEQEEAYLMTIKIDVEDPSRVIASLERMGYNVYYYTSSEEEPVINLQERIQALLKYLNP